MYYLVQLVFRMSSVAEMRRIWTPNCRILLGWEHEGLSLDGLMACEGVWAWRIMLFMRCNLAIFNSID
jgi:hypothetical protein